MDSYIKGTIIGDGDQDLRILVGTGRRGGDRTFMLVPEQDRENRLTGRLLNPGATEMALGALQATFYPFLVFDEANQMVACPIGVRLLDDGQSR